MKLVRIQIGKMVVSFVGTAMVFLSPWTGVNDVGTGTYSLVGPFYGPIPTPAGFTWDLAGVLTWVCPLLALISSLIEIYVYSISKSRPKIGKEAFKELIKDIRDWSQTSVTLAGANVGILAMIFLFIFRYGLPFFSPIFLCVWIPHLVLTQIPLKKVKQDDEDRFPALPKSEGKVTIAPKTDVQSTATVATTQAEVSWRAPTASHVSEVERVSVWRHATYQSGRVRLATKVTNTSEVAVFRVQFSLFLGKTFRVLRIEPPTIERERLAAKLGELLPGEEKQVIWILEPLLSGKQSVDGSVTGVDAAGKIFVKALEPLEVKVECPTFVPPAEATLPSLKQLVETLPAKSERVYYLPRHVSASVTLDAAVKAFTAKNLRHVGTFTKEEGGDPEFDQTAWFYALSRDGGKKYIITSAVSEQNHLIRVLAACEEEEGCMGFIAEAGPVIRQELVADGLVDAESAILELVCERCGTPLPRCPVDQDDGVQCPQCKRIWYLHDLM